MFGLGNVCGLSLIIILSSCRLPRELPGFITYTWQGTTFSPSHLIHITVPLPVAASSVIQLSVIISYVHLHIKMFSHAFWKFVQLIFNVSEYFIAWHEYYNDDHGEPEGKSLLGKCLVAGPKGRNSVQVENLKWLF